MDADHHPVLVGVGQRTWRERGAAGTPLDALDAVARSALDDAGAPGLPAAIDAVVQVPFILTQVDGLCDAMPRGTAAALAERLGLTASIYSADTGGNLPQQFVNLLGDRLAAGKHSAVLLGGVELLSTFLGAVRAGQPFPDWTTDGEAPEDLITTQRMTAPAEEAHGLFEPINAYPLFESALCHAQGLTRQEQQQRLGALISRMSEVAAVNPHAWRRRPYTPEEVVDTRDGNRMIAHPYTKVMNALIAVDQAAAVILTTAGRARELGIDPARWIYLRGAAHARDTLYLSERRELHRSPALELAARAALVQAAIDLDEVAYFDLYSCFPSAVQVACDALGLAVDDSRGLTVTGGMPLFGGPGNNYSLHAIATMVERLRSAGQGSGLVSANGGYLTKHAVGIYATEPGSGPWSPPDGGMLQRRADEAHGPALASEIGGRLCVEAHTVSYGRDGPDRAILLGRLNDGRRCVAISKAPDVLDAFLTGDCIGQAGTVEVREGINHFRF